MKRQPLGYLGKIRDKAEIRVGTKVLWQKEHQGSAVAGAQGLRDRRKGQGWSTEHQIPLGPECDPMALMVLF